MVRQGSTAIAKLPIPAAERPAIHHRGDATRLCNSPNFEPSGGSDDGQERLDIVQGGQNRVGWNALRANHSLTAKTDSRKQD